jgi:hemerythrin-like domain-containing protein
LKRHSSLHALSQHHHFALIQALDMRRAGELPPEKRAAAARKAAERFLRFWNKTGRTHFREEEEVLLPAYARHRRLDEDAAVMKMLAEHAGIRAAAADLERMLAEGLSVEETIAALADTLHDHVRREENEIFPRIEKILAESELETMGRSLTRLHPKGSCDL